MKQYYLKPDTDLIRVKVEYNFMDSVNVGGSGTDLGSPFTMPDDVFDSIFS